MPVVECPSGLVVKVRKFKVSDEDIASDKDLQKKGLVTKALIEAIAKEVVEPGPYERWYRGGSLDWGEVLDGDGLVIANQARIATWGVEYDYDHVCHRRACKTSTPMTYDLSEFPVQPLPEGSINHVKTDEPIRVEVETEEEGTLSLSFRLQRIRHEREAMKLAKKNRNRLSTANLLFRIVDIEGVEKKALRDYISNLDADVSAELRETFDSADCGIDLGVEVECDGCGRTYREDVQLDSDFLFPRSRAR